MTHSPAWSCSQLLPDRAAEVPLEGGWGFLVLSRSALCHRVPLATGNSALSLRNMNCSSVSCLEIIF